MTHRILGKHAIGIDVASERESAKCDADRGLFTSAMPLRRSILRQQAVDAANYTFKALQSLCSLPECSALQEASTPSGQRRRYSIAYPSTLP
jgi:hypothetical protein